VRWPSSDRRCFGAKTMLMALAGLIVVSAGIFLATLQPWLVVAAAMVGNLAVGAGETGPFLALEQVAVTRATPRERLTGVLSFYNLTGYVSSALGAALVASATTSPTTLFVIFLAGGILQMALYGLLRSTAAPRPAAGARAGFPSRPLVRRIAALFALDSLAGAVIQSLVATGSHALLARPHLGWTFGAQLLSGLSMLLAARLAPRLGLVNTMVFSHLISNVLLIAVALAPTALVAAGLLLGRHLLSQMDVPTRQTFLMLAVEDHEREGAATLTNMSRTVAQSASPALTGWVMQGVSLSAPFVLGGGLKIVYDLLLYATIRNVRTR
jgi:MFS family permease